MWNANKIEGRSNLIFALFLYPLPLFDRVTMLTWFVSNVKWERIKIQPNLYSIWTYFREFRYFTESRCGRHLSAMHDEKESCSFIGHSSGAQRRRFWQIHRSSAGKKTLNELSFFSTETGRRFINDSVINAKIQW